LTNTIKQRHVCDIEKRAHARTHERENVQKYWLDQSILLYFSI